MFIEDIVKHLPEVGDPILYHARGIEQLLADQRALQERINEERRILRERVKDFWQPGEIEAARAVLVEEERQRSLAEQKRFDMLNKKA